MSARALHLVIDARPRGWRGPLAAEVVLGKSMLDHVLDVAAELAPASETVVVHAREEEHGPLRELAGGSNRPGVQFVCGPPRADATVLRTDRYYDARRLKRSLKRGWSPESAVLWRLDRPETLALADEELSRRRTYQPLGKYWAFPLAERLAEWLRPSSIRPNALTLVHAGLMLSAAALVSAGLDGWLGRLAAASALAVALVLDTADGRLARLQGTSSAFGRWLDQVLDELADMVLHAAIAWAAFCRDSHPGWLLLGILYASSKYLFQVESLLGEELEGGMKRDGASDGFQPRGGPLTPALSPQAGRGGNADRLAAGVRRRVTAVVRLIGHADVRWHLWIVLAIFGRLDLALAAYSFYFALRTIAGSVRKAVRYA
jgi:CDP-alcohol phosphatidyltransferase-like enzyme